MYVGRFYAHTECALCITLFLFLPFYVGALHYIYILGTFYTFHISIKKTINRIEINNYIGGKYRKTYIPNIRLYEDFPLYARFCHVFPFSSAAYLSRRHLFIWYVVN